MPFWARFLRPLHKNLKSWTENLSRNLLEFWPFNFGDLSQIWPTSECQKEWYKDISRQWIERIEIQENFSHSFSRHLYFIHEREKSYAVIDQNGHIHHCSSATSQYISVILKTLCDKFLENNVTTIIYMTNRLLDHKLIVMTIITNKQW